METEKWKLERPELRSYAEADPRIYAYQTPGVAKHVGWTKIGETWTQTVEARIRQQTQTAGLDWELCWERPARFVDGAFFHDRDFHAYLEGARGVERERDAKTGRPLEWFRLGERGGAAAAGCPFAAGVPGFGGGGGLRGLRVAAGAEGGEVLRGAVREVAVDGGDRV